MTTLTPIRVITVLLFLVSTVMASTCSATAKHDQYIFFLHNMFLESHTEHDEHPEYGRVEYAEMKAAFVKAGFIVESEKRNTNTDVKNYAAKISTQIRALLEKGVPADHITVVGTSKGGYIAQYISTMMANPDINYVFIGCFRSYDIRELPDIQYSGNVLTIYEHSDELGISATQRKETTKLQLQRFKEIELHTNKKHGFLFKALKEWVEPTILWARGEYDAIK